MRSFVPPVLLGLLAALLEAVLLVLRRFQPFDENLAWVLALCFLAGILYLVAAFLVLRWPQPRAAMLVVILVAAVLFRLTLFDLSLTLSDDLYRYQWEGHIQLAGHNPYVTVPADPAVADLRPANYDRLPGPDIPTTYGPVTEMLFRLAASFDGAPAFKLLSLAFDLGALLLLVGLLRRRGLPPVRVLLYGWCPLILLEFAGSGHNDAIAIFLLLLANLLIIRPGSRGVSNIALAAAVAAKWFAGLLVPVFYPHTRWRGLGLFAATLGLLALPFAGAGKGLLNGFLAYAAHWRNNASLYDLLWAASGQEAVATGVSLGVVGGLALYLGWKKEDPLRASYLLIATLLLLAPSVFPWYVTWLVPFLCFFPNPAFLLWTTTLLLSYHVLIDYTTLGVWHYTPWLIWLEYVPVYALLLVDGWKARAKA